MVHRIVLRQPFDQQAAMGRPRTETSHRAITGHADLPQHQVGRRIDAAVVEHELAGFVVLATNLARVDAERSEEHTSELQSLMRNSSAVFCLKKKKSLSV